MGVRAVIIEISKLRIAPDEFLIIRGAEDWTMRQLVFFGEHLRSVMAKEFPDVRVLVLPHLDISVGKQEVEIEVE